MSEAQDPRKAIERGLIFIELKEEVSDRLELPTLVPIFKEDYEREINKGQLPPAAIAAGVEALKMVNSNTDEYDRFLARYYLLEGQRSLEEKDNYQAQRNYQKVLDLDQSELSAEAAFYLARLVTEDDLDEAIRLYQESIRLNPQAPAAHFELGLILRERRDLQGALNEFETAFRLDPNSANLLNEVGDTHLMADNLAQAKSAFRRAAELEPDYWVLPVKLGITEFNMSEYPEAIHDLREGLEMSPEELDSDLSATLYLEGLYYLGMAYKEMNRSEQARKVFRAVLSIAPDHPGALAEINS